MPGAPSSLCALLVLVALTAAGGCQVLDRVKRPKPQPRLSDEATLRGQKLRDDLYYFSDRFQASVSAAADEIASRSSDREVLEMTLLWKLRQIPTMQDIIRTEDPRQAALDAWAMCVRQRAYLREGDGKDVFKDQQPLAVATADKLTEDIVRIAGRYMPPEEVARAQREVEAFAEGVPMKGRFASDLIRASRESTRHGPGILSMLAIPVGGVTETADAIQHVARVVAVFTEVVADMPERTRWQTELLLLETEKLDMVVSMQRDLALLTKSMESISETARSLPEDVRVQLETVLDSTNEVQERLQANLKEARATIAELDGALDKVDRTTATAKEIMDGFNEAAIAWKDTTESVDALMVTIKDMGDAGEAGGAAPGASAPKKPFDVNDYTKAAEQIREAAVQVQAMLGEASTASDATAAIATTSLDALIDRITTRAIMVVASILVAAVVFLVARRVLAVRRPT